MNSTTIVKWDAAIVGDHPPIGRWMRNGEEVKETSAEPHWLIRKLGSLIGFYWVIGVDASKHPGCLEIVHFRDGESPQVTFKRD